MKNVELTTAEQIQIRRERWQDLQNQIYELEAEFKREFGNSISIADDGEDIPDNERPELFPL